MVKITKRINRDGLRNLCINKKWFTCGDCEAYETMLNKTNKDLTDNDVIEIAKDIYDNSYIERFADEYGVSFEEVFDNMVFEVFKIVNVFVIR